MSGCRTQREASEDREVERIMSMTDAEILATVSEEELEQARQALEAAKRRFAR